MYLKINFIKKEPKQQNRNWLRIISEVLIRYYSFRVPQKTAILGADNETTETKHLIPSPIYG